MSPDERLDALAHQRDLVEELGGEIAVGVDDPFSAPAMSKPHVNVVLSIHVEVDDNGAEINRWASLKKVLDWSPRHDRLTRN